MYSRRILKLYAFCFALLLTTLSGCATASRKVEFAGNFKCNTFLYEMPTIRKDHTLVLESWGTGIYTRGGQRFSSTLATPFEDGSVRVLAVDKPGIEYRSKSNDFQLNEQIYTQFIQGDLIKCTKNALVSTVLKTNPKTIIFKGHSEGAEVLVHVYLQLIDQYPQVSNKVKHLILTGTPLVKFSDDFIRTQIFAFNPKEVAVQKYDEFKIALQESNDKYLLENGGLSAKYIRDAFQQSSFKEIFKKLSDRNANAQFYFFHGMNDVNTPVKHLQELIEWNNHLPKNKRLYFYVKYYDADHEGNNDSQKDISNLVLQLTQSH